MSIFKNTVLYGATDFTFKLINFLLFPLYAFSLPVSDFGILALITTVTQLLCIIMNGGQTYALQRYKGEAGGEHAERTGMLCFSAVGILATLGALAIVPWLPNPTLAMLGIIAAWPYQLCQYYLTSLRVSFQSVQFVIISFLLNALSVGLSILLALYFQMGLLGFLAGVAMANAFTAFVCLCYERVKILGAFDKNLARQMIFFGLPFVATDLSNWLYASMDRWMLGEMAGATEVGYYSIAFKISTVVIFMINAFSLAWNPGIMKMYHDDPNYKLYISKSFTKWCFVLASLSSALILFSREILMMTTPSSYWPAAQLIPYICTGLAFHGTLVISTTGLFIEKKTSYLAWGTWGCAIMNFLINLWLIPILGAFGSAIACLLTYLCQSVFYLYSSQRFHFIPLEYRKLAFCILFIAGAFALSPMHFTVKAMALIPTLIYASIKLDLLKFQNHRVEHET